MVVWRSECQVAECLAARLSTTEYHLFALPLYVVE